MLRKLEDIDTEEVKGNEYYELMKECPYWVLVVMEGMMFKAHKDFEAADYTTVLSLCKKCADIINRLNEGGVEPLT